MALSFILFSQMKPPPSAWRFSEFDLTIVLAVLIITILLLASWTINLFFNFPKAGWPWWLGPAWVISVVSFGFAAWVLLTT